MNNMYVFLKCGRKNKLRRGRVEGSERSKGEKIRQDLIYGDATAITSAHFNRPR